MQVDLETGLVVASNHHEAFDVQYRGPGEAALDGLKQQFGVYSSHLWRRKDFGYCLDVAGRCKPRCMYITKACLLLERCRL